MELSEQASRNTAGGGAGKTDLCKEKDAKYEHIVTAVAIFEYELVLEDLPICILFKILGPHPGLSKSLSRYYFIYLIDNCSY